MTDQRSPRSEVGILPGTRVEIVPSDHLPSVTPYVGRRGVTERPESDGCYVRFYDHSYVFAFWGEMKEVTT